MSLVHVSSSTVGGATGAIACVLSANPAAGNTLVVVVGSTTSTLSTTLNASDTLLNTYTALTADVTARSLNYSTIRMFSAYVRSSGPNTVTVNFSGGTSGNRHLAVLEYTDSLLLNVSNSGSGNIALNGNPVTGTTGALSVTQAPSIIVAGASTSDSSGFSAGSGYVLETVHAEDRTVVSTGSYTASFVFNGVTGTGTRPEWVALAVALYRAPDRTLTGSGILTQAAYGTGNILASTGLMGISGAETFGVSGLTQVVTLSGIDSVETFGTPQIDPIMTLIGIQSDEVIGTIGAAGTGTATIGLVSEQAFWDDPTGHWNDPQLLWDDARGAESTLTTQEAFGIGSALNTIDLTGIVSREAFGTIQVGGEIDYGNVNVALVNPQAFWDDPITVWNDSQRWWDDTRISQGIPSVQASGIQVIFHSIDLSGISSIESFGRPNVDAPVFIFISRPPSTWSDPITTWSDQHHFWGDVGTDVALPSEESFGLLGVAATGTATVRLGSILTGERFGLGRVDAPTELTGHGIMSVETFGIIKVDAPATLKLHGIESEETFGTMHASEVGKTPITAARIL